MSNSSKMEAACIQFEHELAGIDKDLKVEVIQDRKNKITMKFRDDISKLRGELTREIDGWREQRLSLMDPEKNLVRLAVDTAATSSAGDLALSQLVGILPEHLISTLAVRTQNPLVKLSALSRATENKDLKASVLDSVQMPTGQIKELASKEFRSLKALLASEVIPTSSSSKLHWAREMGVREKIISG